MRVGAVGFAPSGRRVPLLAGFVGVSLGVHAVGLLAATRAPLPHLRPPPPSQLVVVEVVRAPQATREPAPRPPPPPPSRLAPRMPPRDTPPPNDTPPPEPAAPAPVVVGLTMRSTTVAGDVAAPVGNTLFGKPADAAAAPGDVAPLYVVDTWPEPLEEVRIPYPPEARRLLVEGTVVVRLTIDGEGRVVAANVVSGPGHGLNEAAVTALKAFRFRPATRGGKPTATQITYKYTFSLHQD